MKPFVSRSYRVYFAIATAMAVVTVALVGCNRRSPLPLDTGLTAPSPPTPPKAIALFGISLTPPGLFGGALSSGTAILTQPAPAGGVVVALSTTDPATATPPSAVVIPEGADRADFPISTRTVSEDRQIPIGGTALGTSVTAPLHVWAVLPTFLSWVSDPGDPVGRGAFGRLTTENATFTAGGNLTGLQISANVGGPDPWFLSFAPPLNGRLQIGRYEIAGSPNASRGGMSISGRGACSFSTSSGWFEIRELIVTQPTTTTTMVSRFDATFEQHCSNIVAALRGEVRYTAGAR